MYIAVTFSIKYTFHKQTVDSVVLVVVCIVAVAVAVAATNVWQYGRNTPSFKNFITK